jgi:membrane protease YdiL (CAAX protease family)
MKLGPATPVYLLGLYGLTRFFLRKQKQQDNKINWTPLESVAVTVCIYFLGQLIGGLLIYVILSSFGWNQARIEDWTSNNAIGQFLIILCVEAISIGVLIKFLGLRGANLKTIGLKGRPKIRQIGMVIATYGLYFLSYILLLNLSKALVPGLNLEQEQDIGFKSVTNWQLPFVFISLVILPPLVEEILMRGFLYSGLKTKLPKVAAVIITSLLFASAHLQFGSSAPLLWVAAIDTFTLSLFLIYLREKTDSLWSPIMLHGLKNLIAFLALFVFAVGR